MSNYLIVLTSLELGGAERQALNLADYLLKEGHHVSVIGFFHPGKVVGMCKDKGIPCIMINDRRSILARKATKLYNMIFNRNQEIENYKLFSRLLAEYIRDNNIDYCISYCSPANTFACYAKAYYPKCTFVWYQRDDGLCYEPFEMRDKAIHLADHVLSNGISGYNWILSNHSIKSKVIHNGVRPSDPKRNVIEWRGVLGVNSDQIVCTMIAHFSKIKKNHYQNIYTFKRLIEDGYTNYVMVFAGRADDIDYYNDIRALVSNYHLEKYIIFLNEVDDIAGLLGATDICFFGTNREGNPNGVIEAAMSGLAVVASNLPEIQEVVADENYKYLFTNDDYESAENSLLELGKDNILRRRIGKLNAEKAIKEFSEEKNFKELVEYIR